MPAKARDDGKEMFTVLVTGVNSGLGFAICCRLIDEFLASRPDAQTLHLLFSTRDARKSAATQARLEAHLHQTLKRHEARTPGAARRLAPRVVLEGVQLDLLRFRTVRDLAAALVARGVSLDACVWNAGIANWRGLDWLRATWLVLTDLVHTTTYPSYLLCDVGLVAGAQGSFSSAEAADAKSKDDDVEPRLGRVFTANVFGHYLLTHWLAPTFHAGSRVVWVSSVSALAETFHIDDLQGLACEPSYEASKRLTDLLVLTSSLRSTAPYVDALFSSSSSSPSTTSRPASTHPQMVLTHPGVVGTAIAGLHPIMAFFMFLAFYVARALRSPWHGAAPYKGAVAPVWAVLAPPAELTKREAREGKMKYGSAVDWRGRERVAATETEGWAYTGVVGAVPDGAVTGAMGRFRHARDTDAESRAEFEEQGRRAWREMEELREVWEQRMKGYVPRV